MDVDLTEIPWWIMLVGLEFPAVLALVDCATRDEDHFPGGAADQRAWRRWLVVAVLTVPILVGYLLLIGYYQAVIRRNSPTGR